MTEVSKVTYKPQAEKFYNAWKDMGIFGGEILAAKVLTKTCDRYSKEFENIIKDQNEYILELDDNLEYIDNIQAELEEKIAELEAEKEELLAKEKDGTLTEEDKQRLEEIDAEIETLTNSANDDISAHYVEAEHDEEGINSYDYRVAAATDFGETAVKKGEPLSKTQDKRKSFWRKIFGGWNMKDYRKAGEKLLKSGNNLLDKVDESKSLNESSIKKFNAQKVEKK